MCLASPAAPQIRGLLVAEDAYAPDLVDAEVFAVLMLRHKRGSIDADRLGDGLDVLLGAAVDRVPSGLLVRQAAMLATALSGYDALYAALAARLRCPLLTADGGLAATAVQQLGLPVHHVPIG